MLFKPVNTSNVNGKKVHCRVLLYVVLFSIFCYFRSLYSYTFLDVYTGTDVVVERHYMLASCVLVDLNSWCLYVESLLNICIFVDAFSHNLDNCCRRRVCYQC